MKIALVLEHFNPARGGAEQWTARFAKSLIAHGHEVHVVAHDFDPALAALVTTHTLPKCATRYARGVAAEKLLKGLQVDVIHDMGVGWHCDVLHPHGGAWKAGFEANLLMLPAWMRPWKRMVARWLPRYRDFERVQAKQFAPDGPLVLAVSPMVVEQLCTYQQASPERIRLATNGVDGERFSPEQRAWYRHQMRAWMGVEQDLLLLLVAHNFRLKGVEQAIRAVADLKDARPTVRLFVAGSGQAAPYVKLAEELGIADRVRFLGPVKDPIPLYAAADIYVQPTFYDPCSLVVLEALSCGLPVVTTKANGAGWLMKRAQEGFMIDDPHDHLQLADAIGRMLREEVRLEMGLAARELAERYSWQANFAAVMQVYEEVLARRQADAGDVKANKLGRNAA